LLNVVSSDAGCDDDFNERKIFLCCQLIWKENLFWKIIRKKFKTEIFIAKFYLKKEKFLKSKFEIPKKFLKKICKIIFCSKNSKEKFLKQKFLKAVKIN
jgi:hypothetical protein